MFTPWCVGFCIKRLSLNVRIIIGKKIVCFITHTNDQNGKRDLVYESIGNLAFHEVGDDLVHVVDSENIVFALFFKLGHTDDVD